MAPFSLRARWVVPIDRPPIAGGVVTIADGRIAAVSARPASAGPMTDLGDVVLLPGLVNAHTHLEFSDLPRPLGASGMGLPDWIRLVIAQRKRGDRDAGVAIATGMTESLAAGVTTIGEIATATADFYGGADGLPNVVLLQEAIGFSAGRVDSVFADVESRLSRTRAPAGLSPHAPYTVHPRLLERMVDLSEARGVPLAMHLAESREELQLLATGVGGFRDLLADRSMWDPEAIPAGSRPLDYLRMLVRGPRTLVIHGNYLAPDEVAFLAQHRDRMSVVYCPRTHAYFQHDRYPLEAMLSAGVQLALGTDSRASNPDLSILNELRFVAGVFPAVSPERLLRMATLNAAEALGIAGQVGSLAPGKRADLVAIPCSPSASEPIESIVADNHQPAAVWLAGRALAGADC